MLSRRKLIHNQDIDYTKTIEVSANAEQVFRALTIEIDEWWGQTSNSLFESKGQFTIKFENGYWWTFKIVEYTPDYELIWKCIDGEPDFNKEWIGHVLHWQIEQEHSNKTKLSFHQTGLTPKTECYDECSSTWDMFIDNRLKDHIETKVIKSK